MRSSRNDKPFQSTLVRLVRLAGLALAWVAPAQASQTIATIKWYSFDLYPFYIAGGALKQQGIVDLALNKQLIPALPEYTHSVELVPLKRLELNLRQEPNACALGLLKNPERERSFIFSRPFLAQIPPGVMARRDSAAALTPYLTPDGSLSLSKVLEEGRLTVGVAGGRSYGAAVDGLLHAATSNGKVYVNSSPRAALSLLRMSLLGRVDLVPSFPYEASYLTQTEGAEFGALKFYPLAEQPRFLLGYAACSNSDFGREAIAKINLQLSRQRFQSSVQDQYEAWLDEDSRPLARQIFKQTMSGKLPPP